MRGSKPLYSRSSLCVAMVFLAIALGSRFLWMDAPAGSKPAPSLFSQADAEDLAESSRSVPSPISDASSGGDAQALAELMRTASSGEYQRQLDAIWALQKLGPRAKPAVPLLIGLLTDSDSSVPWSAVAALGAIGDERAVAPLTALLHDGRDVIAESALEALLQIKGGDATELLLRLLSDRAAHAGARGIAAYLLAHRGEERAVLVAFAQQDDVPLVRTCAIKGLRFSDDPRATEAARAALLDVKENEEVRIAAAAALSDLAGGDAVAALAAVAGNRKEDAELRFWAAIDLAFVTGGRIDDAAIIAALEGRPGMFYKNDDPSPYELAFDARRAALHAVAEQGDSLAARGTARRLLRALLGSPIFGVRYIAAAVWFLLALGAWVVWNRRWVRQRQFTVASLLSLAAIMAFGLGVVAVGDAIPLPTDDPRWYHAAECEAAWIDHLNDSLPRRHPLRFCGEHREESPSRWEPQFRAAELGANPGTHL